MMSVFQNQILEQTKYVRTEKDKQISALSKQKEALLDKKKQVRKYLLDGVLNQDEYREEINGIDKGL